MSTVKSASKKRKRDTATEGVVLKLTDPIPGPIGPLLVSYPAIQAPLTTAFQCYANKKAKNESKKSDKNTENDEQDLLVVGESPDVEFISNEAESRLVSNSGCRYLIAVHNRRTNTLNVLPTAKSPHILTRTVKALKSIPPAAAPTQQDYKLARTALGETFGTKKAKAGIRAEERNRVDVSAMRGVMDHLQEGIDKGAAGLMTAEEAKEEMDKNRPIPPFDANTTDPEDIYPLHGIIPEMEWKAISISAFDHATDLKQRVALLPFSWSKWLQGHLVPSSDEPEKVRRKKLKIIWYISAMLAFRRHAEGKGATKDEISEKLPGLPGVIVDGLLARFTETARGSSKHQLTSDMQKKILAYLFALCLKVDNFATDVQMIATDLRMQFNEVKALFKSLGKWTEEEGCKINTLGERERTRLGLPDSSAATPRAVLNGPVEFPKPGRGKRK
ncbi:hypothetical protein H0H81_005816 [Sphagnurus paluster]|uniref:Rpa49 subunit specific to nuclear RNA polymerase I n=1 Tax=Sphagnurus paluster TaxID=117069 RepID=A0A9P7FVK1_9AGAR|nr:hypothetical protein H0H81_005816 [Sphagnurus paluster]